MKSLSCLVKFILPVVLIAGGCVFMDSSFAIEIKSSAFRDGEYIPVRYTGLGEDVSPPLSWSGAPEGTQSYCLIVDDPDAPMGTWDHWILYDIPKSKSSLEEGIPKEATLQDGSKQGVNDFRDIGYDGPAPPPGKPHRYIFTLYALDAELGLEPGLNKESVLKSIKGHTIGKGKLTGLFKR